MGAYICTYTLSKYRQVQRWECQGMLCQWLVPAVRNQQENEDILFYASLF